MNNHSSTTNTPSNEQTNSSYINPFHVQPPAISSSSNEQNGPSHINNFHVQPAPGSSSSNDNINPFHVQPAPGSSSSNEPIGPGSSSSTSQDVNNAEKFPGTHTMGVPAVPTSHPNNQKAAMWGASPVDQYQYQQHHQPQQKPPTTTNPVDSVVHKFNSFTKKAELTANSIWRNLKTGPSVTEAAWAKMNVQAKAITGGGFETLYKQTFQTFPNEKLLKSFACYLSTTTGPVAGTLYLSNVHVAFASDRPLSFTAQSGLETWSYYKVIVPLGKIGTINPMVLSDISKERYIHIVTIDGQDFWFMGFVNYEKACHHLLESLSSFAATGIPVQHAAQHNPSHMGQ
ncbi:hypothetical protein LIER_02451 [Lithospermum erythrorhizon]|uniref:GRAM domain-containing protein n=1 Tax=Lithospermum erythrorhizon TaxID=34254 RepID=A0AAV3NQ81_LITER